MFSVLAFASLAFGAGPSGTYHGTKNVLGQNVQVTLATGDPGFAAFDMTGAPGGDVHCAKEAYELNGSDFTLPNLDTPGDCAHDQFKAAHLTFKSASYDAAADKVTVTAQYLFLTVTVECTKGGFLNAPLAVPSGTYKGTKNVLGQNVQVTLATGDPGFASFDMTGAPGGDVHCAKEAYALNGADFTLPNLDTPGDCAHDQFKAAHLTFKSASYDAAADKVTVTAQYLFLTVTVECTKAALNAPLAVPSGTYKGTKNVLGQNVQVTLATGDPGFASFDMTGAPGGDVHCAKEAYALNGSDFTLPNLDTPGDCAHDQFKAAHLTFKSAQYDAAADKVTVTAQYLFLTVTVECTKAAKTEIMDASPSLQRIMSAIAHAL